MVHVAILAGANKKSFIQNEPKCFKEMPDGKTIIELILDELEKIKDVETISIVCHEIGLKKLKDKKILKHYKKKIYLIEQGKSQFDNIIAAKNYLIKKRAIKKDSAKNFGLVYLFGDTPFRKYFSIREFIQKIKNTDYDLVIPLIPEERIKKYYPLFKKPLIPVYIEGRAANFKEANMIYLNPDKIGKWIAQTLYKQRHTGKLTTMLELRRLTKENAGNKALNAVYSYFIARFWHRTFRKFTPRPFHSPRILYKKVTKGILQEVANKLFKLKVDIVFSSFPDGYIDLDSEKDYKKIIRNYEKLNKEIELDCENILNEKVFSE